MGSSRSKNSVQSGEHLVASKFQTSNLPCAQLAPGKYRSRSHCANEFDSFPIPAVSTKFNIRGSKVTNNI